MIGATFARRLQARAHRGAAWCRTLAADIRALQCDALDQSVRANLAGPAMHYADPVTESLFSQLEGPAEEGAQPHSTAGTALTLAQLAMLTECADDPLLDWILPGGFVLGVLATMAWHFEALLASLP